MCTRILVARGAEDSPKKIAGDKEEEEEEKVSQHQQAEEDKKNMQALQTRTGQHCCSQGMDSPKKIAGDKEEKVWSQQHQVVEEDKKDVQALLMTTVHCRQGQNGSIAYVNKSIWRRRIRRKLCTYWQSA
jgi:hypothetical protein